MTSVVGNMRYFYKGLEIDEVQKAYIEKRISSTDHLLEEDVLQTEVEISIDKFGKFRVEVMIKTPRNLFRAENTTESIEASIDMAVDELQDQIMHTKEKIRTLKRRGSISLKKKTVLDEAARF